MNRLQPRTSFRRDLANKANELRRDIEYVRAQLELCELLGDGGADNESRVTRLIRMGLVPATWSEMNLRIDTLVRDLDAIERAILCLDAEQ